MKSRIEGMKIQKGNKLDAEVEEGNREYKFRLTNLSEEQLRHRSTQLNWRLNEGDGVAYYLIGVEDDGNQLGLSQKDMEESLGNLQIMADRVGCGMAVKQLYQGIEGVTAEVQMRRNERLTLTALQVSVAVVGAACAGKSTLIGVLASGKLDNGRGLARTEVFTHEHEIQTGRTSSLSHHILHFDAAGQVLNSEQSDSRIAALPQFHPNTPSFSPSFSPSVVASEVHSHSDVIKTQYQLEQQQQQPQQLQQQAEHSARGVRSLSLSDLAAPIHVHTPLYPTPSNTAMNSSSVIHRESMFEVEIRGGGGDLAEPREREEEENVREKEGVKEGVKETERELLSSNGSGNLQSIYHTSFSSSTPSLMALGANEDYCTKKRIKGKIKPKNLLLATSIKANSSSNGNKSNGNKSNGRKLNGTDMKESREKSKPRANSEGGTFTPQTTTTTTTATTTSTTATEHSSAHTHSLTHTADTQTRGQATGLRRIRALSEVELFDESERTVSLIDTPGSEKYLKTTLHGLLAHSSPLRVLSPTISAVATANGSSCSSIGKLKVSDVQDSNIQSSAMHAANGRASNDVHGSELHVSDLSVPEISASRSPALVSATNFDRFSAEKVSDLEIENGFMLATALSPASSTYVQASTSCPAPAEQEQKQEQQEQQQEHLLQQQQHQHRNQQHQHKQRQQHQHKHRHQQQQQQQQEQLLHRCLICVSAREGEGIEPMTLEHLSLCVYLQIPLAIVVTKIDTVSRSSLNRLLQHLSAVLSTYPSLLNSAGDGESPAYELKQQQQQQQQQQQYCRDNNRKVVIVENADTLYKLFSFHPFTPQNGHPSCRAAQMAAGNLVPIFPVSSVKGSGISLLRAYLYHLPAALLPHSPSLSPYFSASFSTSLSPYGCSSPVTPLTAIVPFSNATASAASTTASDQENHDNSVSAEYNNNNNNSKVVLDFGREKPNQQENAPNGAAPRENYSARVGSSYPSANDFERASGWESEDERETESDVSLSNHFNPNNNNNNNNNNSNNNNSSSAEGRVETEEERLMMTKASEHVKKRERNEGVQVTRATEVRVIGSFKQTNTAINNNNNNNNADSGACMGLRAEEMREKERAREREPEADNEEVQLRECMTAMDDSYAEFVDILYDEQEYIHKQQQRQQQGQGQGQVMEDTKPHAFNGEEGEFGSIPGANLPNRRVLIGIVAVGQLSVGSVLLLGPTSCCSLSCCSVATANAAAASATATAITQSSDCFENNNNNNNSSSSNTTKNNNNNNNNECQAGKYLPVEVESIRLNNVPIRCAHRGQTVTFKITKASKSVRQLFCTQHTHLFSLSPLAPLPPSHAISTEPSAAAAVCGVVDPNKGKYTENEGVFGEKTTEFVERNEEKVVNMGSVKEAVRQNESETTTTTTTALGSRKRTSAAGLMLLSHSCPLVRDPHSYPRTHPHKHTRDSGLVLKQRQQQEQQQEQQQQAASNMQGREKERDTEKDIGTEPENEGVFEGENEGVLVPDPCCCELPCACWEFEAQVFVLDHSPSSNSVSSQPVHGESLAVVVVSPAVVAPAVVAAAAVSVDGGKQGSVQQGSVQQGSVEQGSAMGAEREKGSAEREKGGAAVRVNYEPVVHIGCVNQSARIVQIRRNDLSKQQSQQPQQQPQQQQQQQKDEEEDMVIRNGETAVCRFRFLYYPEYIKAGSAMIMREGRIKGLGTVLRTINAHGL